MKKHVICILAAALAAAALCGCQANPEKGAVVSKNDGAFDAAVVQSAADGGDATAGSPRQIQYTGSFASTDGTVAFTMNLDREIPGGAMPVVEVAPHYFTPEEARRIAGVLFENGQFYEAEPAFAPAEKRLTRQEAVDAINRWSPYAFPENFADIYPGWNNSPELLESGTQVVKDFIEEYTAALDAIPSDRAHTPAKWQFQPSSAYQYTPEQMEELAVDTSEDWQEIEVTTTRDGIPYHLQFNLRNDSVFNLSSVRLSFGQELSPFDIDSYRYARAMLATEKPTQEQLRGAQEKAQALLDQMGIGEWLVDDCQVSVNEETAVPEYTIVVRAVPVLGGVPAIRRRQLSNLRSEAAYASNYYLTDAAFSFNADGELVGCDITSPVDVVSVVNENTAVLSMDELIQRAKDHLALSDRENYGVSGEYLKIMEEAAGEAYQCQVDIRVLEYGLIRVKAPNTDDRYYYVPGIILWGAVDYVGRDSGTVYESSGTTFGLERNWPLVALNAVDGSVIKLDNPNFE